MAFEKDGYTYLDKLLQKYEQRIAKAPDHQVEIHAAIGELSTILLLARAAVEQAAKNEGIK